MSFRMSDVTPHHTTARLNIENISSWTANFNTEYYEEYNAHSALTTVIYQNVESDLLKCAAVVSMILLETFQVLK